MIELIKQQLWEWLTICIDESDCNMAEWRAIIDAWYDVLKIHS